MAGLNQKILDSMKEPEKKKEVKQDAITLSRIELLHPKVREDVKQIYYEICERLTGKALCRFSHTLRTFKEQDDLYAQGRTKPGNIVSYAKGGQSYHCYGLAIDVVLLIDKDGNGTHESASWDFKTDFDADGMSDWEEIDYVFKMYGWDGLYKANGTRWDLPHFQKTFGFTTPQLLAMVNSGKTINGYVSI